MKKFYYYICFEFQYIFKKLTVIILLMMSIQNIAFLTPFYNIRYQKPAIDSYIKFEYIISKCNYSKIFGIAFGMTLILIAIAKLKDDGSPKAVYSLMTLPISRKIVYISKIISYALAILYLYIAQILNICISYIFYKISIPAKSQMSDGFMLAILRDNFLSEVFPFDFISFIRFFLYIILPMLIVVSVLDIEIRIKSVSVKFIAKIILWIVSVAAILKFLYLISNLSSSNVLFNFIYQISVIVLCILGGIARYEKRDI